MKRWYLSVATAAVFACTVIVGRAGVQPVTTQPRPSTPDETAGPSPAPSGLAGQFGVSGSTTPGHKSYHDYGLALPQDGRAADLAASGSDPARHALGAAGCVPSYLYDNGSSETSVGLGDPGVIVWAQHYVVVAGQETISHVETAFGSPVFGGGESLLGKTFAAGLWSDPTGDGDPSDGALLSSATAVVTSVAEDALISVDIPDHAFTAGDSFFAVAWIEQTADEYPPALDTDQDSVGRAWVTGEVGATFDPGSFTADIGWLEMDSIGLNGVWLLRACPIHTSGPYCGDDTVNGSEECDGADDAACPGLCLVNCTCGCPPDPAPVNSDCVPVVANAGVLSNSTPHDGTGPLGIALKDEGGFVTIWVADLTDGLTCAYVDDGVTFFGIGCFAHPTEAGITTSGVAYDSLNDTLWYLEAENERLVESTTAGDATGNVIDCLPGAGLKTGVTYNAAGDGGAGSFVYLNISSDEILEIDRSGNLIRIIPQSCQDDGKGTYGNSVDVLCNGNLFEVLAGSQVAAMPDRAVVIDPLTGEDLGPATELAAATGDTFVNGIVRSPNLSFMYVVGNDTNTIYKVFPRPVECPVCPGEGDCCVANGTPGCSDPECCQAVTQNDPFCTGASWDALCAADAALYCPDCAVCGDGLSNVTEECDPGDPPGIPADDDACPGLCQADCTCATCGDGTVNQPSEACDGDDDAACPGLCQPDCTCGKVPVCQWDLNGDHKVAAEDLAALLGAWGPNPGHPADFDASGNVGAEDLAQLLGHWGPCCGDGVCIEGESCDDCTTTPNDCTSETHCGDGVDNDCDGLTDCNDPDCGVVFSFLATGDDPSVDGYVRINLDAYGSWASGFVDGGGGDLFNPVGPTGPTEITYTSGFFLFTDLPVSFRELLSDYAGWQAVTDGAGGPPFSDDTGLSREITSPLVLTDTDGDCVADQATSSFRVFSTPGGLVDLSFEHTATLESTATGAVLTQDYEITNFTILALPVIFRLVRAYDGDFSTSAGFEDDAVGTSYHGSGSPELYVFEHDANFAVALSSPDASIYYGGKHGISPGDDLPPYDFGTDTEVWDAFGVPLNWENHIAGVGYATDGDSGPSPAGCTAPCDGFIGLSIPVGPIPQFGSTSITVRHTYGATAPPF